MELERLEEIWTRRVEDDGPAPQAPRVDGRTATFVALGVELALALVALVLLGSFVAAHLDEPRLALAGAALHVFVVLVVALQGHLLVHLARLDHGGPVLDLQRGLERAALLEYRVFKWALLGGVLLWSLVPIVVSEAALGVDLFAHLPSPWLVANALFGLAVLALGQAWSRRHVERADAGPWARRLVDHLSGQSLRRARANLADLARFEAE